ncbi:MAG: ATP synthase F0 subunit B [Ilumatobacter sp.]|uniref:ATP synthase F0 subunit B n=1 Tax=Ilumatobacter sp. TaxID=1967498 RepID=UPI0026131C49|nr:ATP synthase F0 subunit B [Ilumatobacter sp.]MDJ0768806.1 ATP synthase F0 subunit B [Ilumatobacter sp.]
MLTAVVTRGLAIEVGFIAADDDDLELMSFEESQDFCEFPYETLEEYEANAEAAHPCQEGPSPLAVEVKELAWGAGAFIVLALLMRFWLFPAVKKGMEARYSSIREGHEQADTARAAARAEVAEYESALATVRSEANERVEAARQTLEAERTARLAEVNAAIAAKREAAAAEAQAARDAARADVAAAVGEVTSRTIELSIGRAPDGSAVSRAVDDAMSAGVPS